MPERFAFPVAMLCIRAAARLSTQVLRVAVLLCLFIDSEGVIRMCLFLDSDDVIG